MKWGYASTAAIVRSLQKDLFYRQVIQSDLKLILLDHLSTTEILIKWPVIVCRCRSILEVGGMAAISSGLVLLRSADGKGTEKPR